MSYFNSILILYESIEYNRAQIPFCAHCILMEMIMVGIGSQGMFIL